LEHLVRIPLDAEIRIEKLTRYLLLPRTEDDKSRFLATTGFDQSNPEVLLAAIRAHAIAREAVSDGSNDYGEFLRVEDPLVGPRGTLAVVTIWIRWKLDGTIHFVTLKPYRSRK
jgi:hypothetical protein